MIEISDGKIQLCVVSQFPATDDVHLLGREESTNTLGANFIRSKGRYFFTVACVQTSPISFVARGKGTKEIGDVCTEATLQQCYYFVHVSIIYFGVHKFIF